VSDFISYMLSHTYPRGRKSQMNAENRRNDSFSILVHDIVVIGPITAGNLSLAKGLAAERARFVLGDPNSEHSLSKLCDCGKKMVVDSVAPSDVDVDIENLRPEPQEKPDSALNDETEEGFAKLAEMTRVKFEDLDTSKLDTVEDDTDSDEQAVEDMLAAPDIY
jgi:endoribonuclease Dicer